MKNLFTYPLDAGTYHIDSAHIGDGTFGLSYRVDEMLQGNYLAHQGLDPVLDLSQTWQTLTPELSKYINYFDDKKELTNLSQYDFWNTPLVTATTALNEWDLQQINYNFNSFGVSGLQCDFTTTTDNALWDGMKVQLVEGVSQELTNTPVETISSDVLSAPLYVKRTVNDNKFELFWNSQLTDPVDIYYIASDTIVNTNVNGGLSPIVITHSTPNELPAGLPINFSNIPVGTILQDLGNLTYYVQPLTSTTFNISRDPGGSDLVYLSDETSYKYMFNSDVDANNPMAIVYSINLTPIWGEVIFENDNPVNIYTNVEGLLGQSVYMQYIEGGVGSEAMDYLKFFYDLNPAKFPDGDPSTTPGITARIYKLYKDVGLTQPWYPSDITTQATSQFVYFDVYSTTTGDLIINERVSNSNEPPYTFRLESAYAGIPADTRFYTKQEYIEGEAPQSSPTALRGTVYSDQGRTTPRSWIPPVPSGWNQWQAPNKFLTADDFTWDIDDVNNSTTAFSNFGLSSSTDANFLVPARPQNSVLTNLRAYPGRVFNENNHDEWSWSLGSEWVKTASYDKQMLLSTNAVDVNNVSVFHPINSTAKRRKDITIVETFTGSAVLNGESYEYSYYYTATSDCPPFVWIHEDWLSYDRWRIRATDSGNFDLLDLPSVIEPFIWVSTGQGATTGPWSIPENKKLDIVWLPDPAGQNEWLIELWDNGTKLQHFWDKPWEPFYYPTRQLVREARMIDKYGFFGPPTYSDPPTDTYRNPFWDSSVFQNSLSAFMANCIVKTSPMDFYAGTMPITEPGTSEPIAMQAKPIGAYGNSSPIATFGKQPTTSGNVIEVYDTNADGNTIAWMGSKTDPLLVSDTKVSPHADEPFPRYVDSATLRLGGSKVFSYVDANCDIQFGNEWADYYLPGGVDPENNAGDLGTIDLFLDGNGRMNSIALGTIKQRGRYPATETEFALNITAFADDPACVIPVPVDTGTQWRDFGDNSLKVWPEIAPQSASVYYDMPGSTTKSPFGTKYVLPTGRYKWQLTFTYPPLTEAQFKELSGVAHAVGGTANPFYLPLVYNGNKILWDYGLENTPLVRFRKEQIDLNDNTVIEAGLKTFLVDGFAGSQVDAIKRGEVWEIEPNINGGLNTITNTTNANVFGEVMVSLASPLEFAHNNGDLINRYPTKCVVTLAENDFVYRKTLEGLYEVTVTFNLDKFED